MRIALVIIVFFIVSCEKVVETYIGLPLQPTNINAEFEPGLNVFGMLHYGKSYGEYQNYFEVQEIRELIDTTTMVVKDARLNIENRNSGNLFNLYHVGEGIYGNDNLRIKQGQKWDFKCVKDTFIVTSSTVVPYVPEIVDGSVTKNENTLDFEISYDASAFMYDIYYITDTLEENIVLQRIIPEQNSNTFIHIDVPAASSRIADLLYVIAYDKNYEKYINTSNTFFKPNAFRPRFTTVNGGYGCFASCASLEINFKFFSFRPD